MGRRSGMGWQSTLSLVGLRDGSSFSLSLGVSRARGGRWAWA